MHLLTPLLLISMPSSCAPSGAALEAAIKKAAQVRHVKTRAKVASALSKRILLEARRYGLDPIALVAIASAESDFRPWVRGPGFVRRGPTWSKRLYEYGVWQLFLGGAYTLAAGRALQACPKDWARCPAPDVYRARRKHLRRLKYFSKRELKRSYIIGTWVAAFEISHAIEGCRLRHKRGHWRYWMTKVGKGLGMNRATMVRLSRYGHYNTGAVPPTSYYLKRLFKRYAKFHAELCKPDVR
jgi:hypothetical protein